MVAGEATERRGRGARRRAGREEEGGAWEKGQGVKRRAVQEEEGGA